MSTITKLDAITTCLEGVVSAADAASAHARDGARGRLINEPASLTKEKIMILTQTERFTVSQENGAIEILMTDEGLGARLIGDGAEAFLASLDQMLADREDPESRWHGALLDNCVAAVCDDAVINANPHYGEWREAALALGWRLVDRDPNEDWPSKGPELHHEETDRVMPIAAWRMAVMDLGYENAREALDEKSGPGL